MYREYSVLRGGHYELGEEEKLGVLAPPIGSRITVTANKTICKEWAISDLNPIPSACVLNVSARNNVDT